MGVKGRIIVAYLASVLFYGVFVSFFTSTVHAGVDEDIYLALAKSFHYSGCFEIEGQAASYSCVLYSMLISVAYYFYSPENILLFMRLIGVAVMCSAIFPIWLLAKGLLGDSKRAFRISCLSLCFPYMFDCAYLMQEVLSYPLFLWVLYFFYCSYRFWDNKKGNSYMMLCAVFSVLCLFTKTYMFFIPVAINVLLVFDKLIAGQKWKKVLGKAVSYDGAYLLTGAAIYIAIRSLNGFQQGSDHYGTQFMSLFPMNANTFLGGVLGICFYVSFLFLNMGVLPPLSLFACYKKMTGHSQKMARFCILSLIFLVLEIVILIVLTEERGELLPHKFLFRYFHIFVPIVTILFAKRHWRVDFLENRKVGIAAGIFFLFAFCYFLVMKGGTRQAIMDGHYFLLLENITKYILPFADAVIVLILGVLFGVIVWAAWNGKRERPGRIVGMGIAAVAAMAVINCFQLPVYSNNIASGKIIQKDAVRMAEYLNGENYDFIYYVNGGNYYLRNFYGYLRQPYRAVPKEKLEEEIQKGGRGKTAVIAPKEVEIDGLKAVEIETEKYTLYTIS